VLLINNAMQGMNFEHMWSVQQHSDLLYVPLFQILLNISDAFFFLLSRFSFWIVAIPIFVVVTIAALWSKIRSMWRYVQRRAEIKKMLGVCIQSSFDTAVHFVDVLMII